MNSPTSQAPLTLSVILPVYRNRDHIMALHQRLCTVLEQQALHFELIFVDDACPENSPYSKD